MVNQIDNPEFGDAIGECEKELQRLIREVGITPDQLPGPAPSMEERRKTNQEKRQAASMEGPKRGREKRRKLHCRTSATSVERVGK